MADTIMIKKIKELAKVLKDLEDIKVQKAKLEAKKEELSKTVIPELMEKADIELLRVSGVGRVQLQPDIYASINKDNKEEARAWLIKHKFGYLMQPTINASTFKAWAKEQIKAGTELPKELFNYDPFMKVVIVKGG